MFRPRLLAKSQQAGRATIARNFSAKLSRQISAASKRKCAQISCFRTKLRAKYKTIRDMTQTIRTLSIWCMRCSSSHIRSSTTQAYLQAFAYDHLPPSPPVRDENGRIVSTDLKRHRHGSLNGDHKRHKASKQPHSQIAQHSKQEARQSNECNDLLGQLLSKRDACDEILRKGSLKVLEKHRLDQEAARRKQLELENRDPSDMDSDDGEIGNDECVLVKSAQDGWVLVPR